MPALLCALVLLPTAREFLCHGVLCVCERERKGEEGKEGKGRVSVLNNTARTQKKTKKPNHFSLSFIQALDVLLVLLVGDQSVAIILVFEDWEGRR